MSCPICKSKNESLHRTSGFTKEAIKECDICETVYIKNPSQKPKILYIKGIKDTL